MLGSIGQRLSYANVMATAALFVALGGVSYAATQLPANSVGSKQLKAAAVTKAKVDPALLKSLIGKSGPAGVAGAAGAAGAAGTNGSNGTNGVNGTDLISQTPLASGQTEVGTYGAAGELSAAGDLAAAISFSQPLPAQLDAAHVIETAATPAHCPGAGRADPGYLCIYRAGNSSNISLETGGPADPVQISLTGNGFGSSRWGAVALYHVSNTSNALVYGSWAVTAP